MKKSLLMWMFLLLVANSRGWAQQTAFTLQDRDLLIELRTRIQEMDKRVEQRFEQIEKRFEQVDKRFEQMMNVILVLAGIFGAITVCTIGFAVWDRRSMIRPFETKVAELEKKIESNHQVGQKLIGVLKDFSYNNVYFADILRRFNIL